MGAVTADPALGYHHHHQRNHCRERHTPCDDPSVRCCAPMTRCDGDGSGMAPQVGRRSSRETSLNRRSPRLLPANASTTHPVLSALPRPRAPLGAPDTSGYSARFGVYAPRRDIRLDQLPAELSAASIHPVRVARYIRARLYASSCERKFKLQRPIGMEKKGPSNTTASRHQESSVASGTQPRPA